MILELGAKDASGTRVIWYEECYPRNSRSRRVWLTVQSWSRRDTSSKEPVLRYIHTHAHVRNVRTHVY